MGASNMRYRERKMITRKYKIAIGIIVAVFILLIAAIIGIGVVGYCDMTTKMSRLQTQYDDLSDKNEAQFEQINDLQSERDQLNQQIKDKDNEIEELQKQTETEPETEQQIETDSNPDTLSYDQVIDQYSYVMTDSCGNPNDMNGDLVYYAYDLATKFGFNPDLLFGIIKVESEGHANAYNPYTGATGLGQIISTTGSYICKNMMGGKVYDHSYTPYVPEQNIAIIATYLEYLYKKYDGSTMDVIQEYSGSSNYDQAFAYYMKVCNACGYCIE